MSFFTYIKNNKALIPVFFSGILTWEVFDHFFSEGIHDHRAFGNILRDGSDLFSAIPTPQIFLAERFNAAAFAVFCLLSSVPDLLSAFLWIGENQLDQGENYS